MKWGIPVVDGLELTFLPCGGDSNLRGKRLCCGLIGWTTYLKTCGWEMAPLILAIMLIKVRYLTLGKQVGKMSLGLGLRVRVM